MKNTHERIIDIETWELISERINKEKNHNDLMEKFISLVKKYIALSVEKYLLEIHVILKMERLLICNAKVLRPILLIVLTEKQ